jgi:hypothetical protein
MTEVVQDYADKRLLSTAVARLKNHGKILKVTIRMQEHTTYLGYGFPPRIARFPAYVRTDKWTDESPADLRSNGYKRVVGLYDSIVWWGVPVYLRIDGGKVFDVKHAVDGAGHLMYSQDTAGTLHDSMQSTATQEFIKGMGKVAMSSMDLQKLAMIGIIGVGAVFGLMMMGVI